MLMNCPECKKEISDQAAACPNCGFKPTKKAAANAPWPFALALAVLLLVLTGVGPLSAASMIALASVLLALVSGFRREVGWLAPSVLIFIVFTVLGSRVPREPGGIAETAATSSGAAPQVAEKSATPESQVEIEDWNWGADRNFGVDGAVIWNVKVKNKSSRYISMVRVEMVTYDKDQKMISTNHTYVNAIPPGESRSSKAYGDYYGTEHNAQAQVVDVIFSR